MSLFATRHRRTAAVLATAALAAGGVSTAIADSGSGTPAPAEAPPAAHSYGYGFGGSGGSFLSMGLFKAIFHVFRAVHSKVPAIAAPIIAQGVTDGTITSAQADQLTAIFSGHGFGPAHGVVPAPAEARSLPVGPTGATGATGPHGHHGMWLSSPQVKVLRKVMQAVMAQLPAIAKPALDADVADKTITQKQEDLIMSVINAISSFKPGNFGIGAYPSPGEGPTTAASLNPLAALQSGVTARVGKKAGKKAKHNRKRHRRHASR